MSDNKFTTHGNEPIEARIVAWVLGEASAFEAEELQRLCEEQPELAVFKRRIEAVHGLAEQAHDRTDDARWKLSTRKRAAIEELIGAEEEAADDLARDQRAGQSARRALLAIAACLVFTVVVAGLMTPVILGQKKKSEQSVNFDYAMPMVAEVEEGDYADFDSSTVQGKALGSIMDGKKPESLFLQEESRSKSLKSQGKGGTLSKYKADARQSALTASQKPGVGGQANAEPAPTGRATPKKAAATDESLSESLGGAGNRYDAFAPHGDPMSKADFIPSSPRANTINGVAPLDKLSLSGGARGPVGEEGKDLDGANFSGSDASTESALELKMELQQQGYTPTPGESSSREMNKRINRERDAEIAFDEVRFEEGQLKTPASEMHRESLSPEARRVLDVLRDQPEKDSSGLLGMDDVTDQKSLGERKVLREKAEQLRELASRRSGELSEKEKLQEEVTMKDGSPALTLDEDSLKQEPRRRPVVTDEETVAAEEPYSTFSLNINDASFRVAQAALARGEMPDPSGIKVEQFYNAVDYGDPAPAAGQPVTSKIEQTAHPVIPGRNLVRIAIKTASEGRSQGQPLRLTLLIDQSGSMSREDRRTAMVEALEGLRGLLKEHDQVNIIGFARAPRLLGEAIRGNQGQLGQLVNIEANEGGTNLEEALKLGEQLAQRHRLEGAQNRIVLFTDGAANLGDADPDSLADKIKDLRQKGIAFDIAGIVADGLNDELLGEMARHGNGRYYVVGKGGKDRFAEQLAGAFRPAAENVKVQVHFNPERVGRYKLIGFEKDRLNKEDFRNDSVDAAEMAAEEAGVAIYQVETLPEGEGEIGEVSVRFRDVASGQMVERSWTIANEIATPAIDQAQPSMQLATLAMLAGEKLRGGPLADAINFNEMGEVIAQVNQHFKGDPKAAEMLEMIEQLK